MIHSHVGDKQSGPSKAQDETVQDEWKEGPDKVVEKSGGPGEDVSVSILIILSVRLHEVYATRSMWK